MYNVSAGAGRSLTTLGSRQKENQTKTQLSSIDTTGREYKQIYFIVSFAELVRIESRYRCRNKIDQTTFAERYSYNGSERVSNISVQSIRNNLLYFIC